MALVEKVARGAHTGWCMRCGADTFNFVRHRCPRPIEKKAAYVIIAASDYCRARESVRTASLGTFNHAQAQKKEQEKFLALQAAVAALNEGSTNGEES
jgi:hypothetical protein